MLLMVWLVTALFAIGAIVGTCLAQKTSVPKPQDKVALGENEVRQLSLLMDTDKTGKITKQEGMRFMEAEFEKLDKNKSGELDAKEVAESILRVSHLQRVSDGLRKRASKVIFQNQNSRCMSWDSAGS
jgi:hypothetical protein